MDSGMEESGDITPLSDGSQSNIGEDSAFKLDEALLECVDEMDSVWCLWVDGPTATTATTMTGTGTTAGAVGASSMTEEEYLASLVQLFSFRSMPEFVAQWKEFGIDERVTHESTVRVFRDGVRPLWEAPQNVEGGKWLVTLPGVGFEAAIRHFKMLVAGMALRRFSNSGGLLGCVLSVRPYGAALSLWNKDSRSTKQISKVKKKLRAVFDLPKIKYQIHRETIVRSRAASNASSSSSGGGGGGGGNDRDWVSPRNPKPSPGLSSSVNTGLSPRGRQQQPNSFSRSQPSVKIVSKGSKSDPASLSSSQHGIRGPRRSPGGSLQNSAGSMGLGHSSGEVKQLQAAKGAQQRKGRSNNQQRRGGNNAPPGNKPTAAATSSSTGVTPSEGAPPPTTTTTTVAATTTDRTSPRGHLSLAAVPSQDRTSPRADE